MELSDLIVKLDEKHAEMVKELSDIFTKNGNVKVYTGDMEPFTEGHIERMLYGVDMVTEPEEPTKYPQGYLHLGEW